MAPKKNKLSIQDNLHSYFPANKGLTLKFVGVGNEFASFTRRVKFTDDNLVQIHDDNGGTIVASVYKVQKDKVIRLAKKAEFYEGDNLISKVKDDPEAKEVILKKPLRIGTSWKTADGNREIIEVDQRLKVPAGEFYDVIQVKVTTNKNGKTFKNYEYYAKNIGLIMRKSISGEYEITSKLKSFSKINNQGATRELSQAMFQADLRNTGVYRTKEIKEPVSLKWDFKIEQPISSDPVVADGNVYFGSVDGNLYAVNLDKGEKEWKFKTGNTLTSTPTIINGIAYFGSYDRHFYVVDTTTKEQQWKLQVEGRIASAPVLKDQIAYFGDYSGNFYAINLKTKKKEWEFSTAGDIVTSPALEDGIIYFGNDAGEFYALDIEQGKKKWVFETDLANNKITASPTVVNGLVCFGSSDGNIYGLDSNTGQEKWSFKTEGTISSSPVVKDGILYSASEDGKLYAIDTSTGKEEWQFSTPEIILSSSIIVGNNIYFATFGEKSSLYAIDINSGRENWNFNLESGITSGPIIVDGIALLGSSDGSFYALE